LFQVKYTHENLPRVFLFTGYSYNRETPVGLCENREPNMRHSRDAWMDGNAGMRNLRSDWTGGIDEGTKPKRFNGL